VLLGEEERDNKADYPAAEDEGGGDRLEATTIKHRMALTADKSYLVAVIPSVCNDEEDECDCDADAGGQECPGAADLGQDSCCDH